MPKKQKTIAQKKRENFKEFMKHGPGLRYSTNQWIAAKSHDGNYVLIGGLGAIGVGHMWFPTTDARRQDPEYAKAPVTEYNPTRVALDNALSEVKLLEERRTKSPS